MFIWYTVYGSCVDVGFSEIVLMYEYDSDAGAMPLPDPSDCCLMVPPASWDCD